VWVAAARSGHVRYWTNNKVCRNYYVQRKKIHDWEELNTRPRLWYHARVSSSTGPTIRPMWYIRGKWVFYQIPTIEVESRAIRGGWATLVVHIMLWFRLERGGNGTKRYRKMKYRQRARLCSMGRKRDMPWWRDDIARRISDTEEGKGRRRRQLGWRESYLTEKWRKFTRSIQLLQMDGEDLKQLWVNFFFENICNWDLVLFISSRKT
jgi:hypothetical protein